MSGSRVMPESIRHGDFIDALHRARATSQSTAVALSELPSIAATHLSVFLAADMIREAAPGTYYVPLATQRASPMGTAPFTPIRVALMMGVWLIAIAVPFVVWLVAR